MSSQRFIHSATPDADVNAVLKQLIDGLNDILGSQLAGVYLYGSLTSGDFDRQSDIDVLVATRDEVSESAFSALEAMHAQIATGDSWCATQLEVAYVPLQVLRRYHAEASVYPHMDRGKGERLHLKEHWSDCVVQRHVLRERGITITGPDPATLIEPISADDLRGAMRELLPKWAAVLLGDPAQLARRGSQSYVVLSICRILYTLETGAIASKREAAEWARSALDKKWSSLVSRAWSGRDHPDLEAEQEDISGTLALVRYAFGRLETPSLNPR